MSNSKHDPISILYFSDLLCVWAYVAQIRLDELISEHGDAIDVHQHFRPIFGDTHRKITKGWAKRGGFAAYGQHVLGVAARFDHVEVHPEIWTRNVPQSSLSPHLFLNAVRLLEPTADSPPDLFDRTVWALRKSFFKDLVDIGNRTVQMEMAESLGIPRAEIEKLRDSGAAHAAMSHDLSLANKYDVSVSPTVIFNEGRQRLVGNVGYRILEANVTELLHKQEEETGEQLSWC